MLKNHCTAAWVVENRFQSAKRRQALLESNLPRNSDWKLIAADEHWERRHTHGDRGIKTTLGTGTLDATGTATFSTSTLTAGSHTVTRTYNGSTNFANSRSAAVTQVVQ